MQPEKFRLLFLTAFSHQGGIEKFNRAFLKAFSDIIMNRSVRFSAHVLHDHSGSIDPCYVEPVKYKSYSGNVFFFIIIQLSAIFRNEVLVLGHLNLSVIGYVRKLIFPNKKLILICHGIEVFTPVKGIKKKILQQADQILAVSSFTKEQLIQLQGVSDSKVTVFPNTIDPFFPLPETFKKPEYLKKRYGLQEDEKVLFTLTRLNSREGYKGYDKVLRVLPILLAKGVSVKYIIAGKADMEETIRVNRLLDQYRLHNHVIITGFLAEEEIADHFQLSDVFVMPSKGEGFGIVYIEAMACGLPVIAGNRDGSTEALQFGALGTLIDPDSSEQLTDAIMNVISKERNPADLQKRMLEHFSFSKFEKRLEKIFLN